jgi:Uma2 family endonuclease
MPDPPRGLLLARRDDYYAAAHPTAADVQLIVEVAETSRIFDREVKGALYAENSVREYWLVDLEADRIEIHRRPEGTAWRDVSAVGRGKTIAPEAFPDFEAAVDDILP